MKVIRLFTSDKKKLNTTIFINERQDIKCFDEDSCFALPFGLSAISMMVAATLLVCGWKYYTIKVPQGSIMTQVICSIWVI